MQNTKPKLHGFYPAFGLPDPSPFTLKVYLFLKRHEIDFELVPGDPRSTPHKKIPVLEHNGTIIPDSEIILDYLSENFSLADKALTPEQEGFGHMLVRGLDEKLYWSIVYARWMDDQNARKIRDALFVEVPTPLRKLIFSVVRRQVKKDLYSQGTGRLSNQEIYDFVAQDLESLSKALSDKPFLFGETMSRYDCALAASIGQMLAEGLDSPHATLLERHSNLLNYWARIKEAYIPLAS